MKNNPVSIRIAKPCHEDWDNMTPNDQGRFCGSCQKNVTDFSTMTDNEILDFLKEHTGSMCGQLRGSQLNRAIVQTRLSGSNWKLNSFFTALMVASGAGIVSAQTAPPNPPIIIKQSHPRGPVCPKVQVTEPAVKGQVLNAMILDTMGNNPLAFATVQIKGTEIRVQTNEDGDFSLAIPDSLAGDSITLLIYAPGYRVEEYTFAANNANAISRIEVGLEERMMKGEMIIEEPPRKCGTDKRQ